MIYIHEIYMFKKVKMMQHSTELRERDLPQQNSRAPNQDLLLETSVCASCNNLTPVYQNEKHAKVYHMLDTEWSI